MAKLELLSPAGDMERLKMAVLYGADAVYLAGTDFGMRSFAGNFTPEELPKAVDFAHSHGVKVHVTVNTFYIKAHQRLISNRLSSGAIRRKSSASTEHTPMVR